MARHCATAPHPLIAPDDAGRIITRDPVTGDRIVIIRATERPTPPRR